jgi:hypothetical protein
MAIRYKKARKLIAASAASPSGPKPFALADFNLAGLRNRRSFGRQFCAGK